MHIEIDANPEETLILKNACQKAFERLDRLFGGRFADISRDLRIQIGDGLTESGGQTVLSENKILFDRQKMLLSLAEAEKQLAGVLDPGDWTGVMSAKDAARSGSCMEYNFIHEIAHILAQTDGDEASYHRIDSSESPTRYGRQPDKFSRKKDHEALAEGFTYITFGRPVGKPMQAAIDQLVQEHLRSLA